MQKNLKRGLSHGVTELDSKTWPGLPELSLLRVLSLIWPTSDMNHHVVSPARLLMGSYLGLCRVRSLPDLASGLFLCTLFLQYEELSKRLVPEAINFLYNALLHLMPHKFKDEALLPGCFPSPDFRSERCSSLTITPGKATEKLTLDKPNLTKTLTEGTDDTQTKVDLSGLALEVLGQFADLYKGLDGFIELYEPAVILLGGIKYNGLPADLTVSCCLARSITLLTQKLMSGQACINKGHTHSTTEVLCPIAPSISPSSPQAHPYRNLCSSLRTLILQLPAQS